MMDRWLIGRIYTVDRSIILIKNIQKSVTDEWGTITVLKCISQHGTRVYCKHVVSVCPCLQLVGTWRKRSSQQLLLSISTNFKWGV